MIIILSLLLSITACLYLLQQYILKGDKKYRKRFVLFFLANIYLILMVMGLYIFLPSLFENVDSTFALWVFSGLLMALTLSAKIQILKAISKRITEQKRQAEIIKDISSVQNEAEKSQSDRLMADRQSLYRQMPYRHFRNRELKKQQEEERRKSANQPAKSVFELATSKEMFVFLSSMPFFLLCSAYFLAKIINYLIYEIF